MFCPDVNAMAAQRDTVAVGMTWMASKIGGLNVKEWLQPRKQRPPRSHRVEPCGKPTHYPLGKADDTGEVTSMSTPYPTVAEVQTSKQGSQR